MGLDHRRAPYAEALLRHAGRDPLMFMVPGHAATPTGLTADLADFVGEQAVRLDIPQLVEGIDVGDDSPLDEALELAADAWGAHRTWFLGNGSSQGNRMAVIAAASGVTDGAIVAQRSAHSSLTDGLVVTGLVPEWVLPEIDEPRGINHGLTAEAFEAAFARLAERGESPRAAYIVSPSYFGAISDIPKLAAIAHEHGVPLIVDAAWGAHFGFDASLPDFPTALGADIVVTSAHKMGGALGQAAMLHLASGPFTEQLEPLLDRAYHLTQTTSASSLLFGSMDIARRSLVQEPELLRESVDRAERLRALVRQDPQLSLVSDEFGEYASIVGADPLRVSIAVPDDVCTGYDMRAGLAQDHAILLEIATSSAVVAFLGPGKPLDIERLVEAMSSVLDRAQDATASGDADEMIADAESVRRASLALPASGERKLSPRQAFFAATELVSHTEAAGRISADALAAYPPGIPNVVPGEAITADTVEFLRAIAASPIGFVRGAVDSRVTQFRVVVE